MTSSSCFFRRVGDRSLLGDMERTPLGDLAATYLEATGTMDLERPCSIVCQVWSQQCCGASNDEANPDGDGSVTFHNCRNWRCLDAYAGVQCRAEMIARSGVPHCRGNPGPCAPAAVLPSLSVRTRRFAARDLEVLRFNSTVAYSCKHITNTRHT